MNKRNYNKNLFGQILEPNDRVLSRNVSDRGGTGKLRSYWEKDIYVQWNLSKANTYGTEVFVRFREVSALERFELKSSQI